MSPHVRWAAALAIASTCALPPLHAQGSAASDRESRSVQGRIVLGTRQGSRPLPGHWVSLHRIDTRGGADRRASGPVDSARTDANGRYAFRYDAEVHDSVLFVVMTMYGGIAYPTPLRQTVVRGDDAELVVFDTASVGVPIAVRARHLVIAAPRDSAIRTVLEVFDLSNDSTVTVVAGRAGTDSTAVWSTRVPPAATTLEFDPEGDVRRSTVRRRDDRLELFAAMAPGARRVAFSYALPAEAFPLDVPMERHTELLEILVQEPLATVEGPGVTEVAAVEARGQFFRRYLAQDLAPDVVLRVTMPEAGIGAAARAIPIIVAVFGAVMLAGLILALTRSPRHAVAVGPDRGERLLHALAVLDARFEKIAAPTDEQRAAHQRERRALREQLGQVLGAEP